MRSGQRSVRGQCPRLSGRIEIVPHLPAEFLEDAGHMGVLVGQTPSEGDLLPQGNTPIHVSTMDIDQMLAQPGRSMPGRAGLTLTSWDLPAAKQ